MRASEMRRRARIFLVLLAVLALAACDDRPAAPTWPPARELAYCDWVDYQVRPVMEAFEKEYGTKIKYVPLPTQEAFAEALRGGKCDVAVIGNELMPALVAGGLLAEVDYRNVLNFRNVAANFRDLVYDPNNRFSIPFRWGTIGLLVRTDQATRPAGRWADLGAAGKTALWDMPRNAVPVALKAAGYSVNSEAPAELEAALNFLLARKAAFTIWPAEAASIAPTLVEDRAVMAFGWSFDALAAREGNPNITYILPEEGAILWGESLVIGTSTTRKSTAEAYIDFILRPEMSAQVTNVLHFATTNEAAHTLVDPKLRNDPIIFPPNEYLKNAEIILPISPEGEKRYTELWARFLASGQHEKDH